MDLIKETTFDLPVKYKNLLLYPVRVRQISEFTVFSECLKTEKNNIPDANIIMMTELKYLYWATEQNEKTPYIYMLDRLLSLVLRDEDSFGDMLKSISRYKYTPDGKPFFMIGDDKYDSKDYEKIKKIIAEQNMIDLPDENISKEVKDSLEKARRYKAKIHGGGAPASLEDYIIAVAISTGWSLEYIYDMTIRKFQKAMSRMDNLIHYKIYLTASLSGMVDFKDKSIIKHWLSNLDSKDKYSDVSVNLEEMQKKLSPDGGKSK